ncbi:hypothetical protein ACFL35_18160 [Candidatus Riflebacteria bacterium]
MQNSKKAIILPFLTIAFGMGWLLNSMNLFPGVDWVWSGSLAALGIANLVVTGIDKFSVVIGPFLIITSLFSILRQTGKIPVKIELPCLVIVFGILWLGSQLSNLPGPEWMKIKEKKETETEVENS